MIRLIRDRGSIKWTAMMLPEHVERLREWKEEEKIPPRKELDEQQFEEWNYLIAHAIELHTPLAVKYWEDHQLLHEVGFIRDYHAPLQALRLITKEGNSACDSY